MFWAKQRLLNSKEFTHQNKHLYDETDLYVFLYFKICKDNKYSIIRFY